MLPAHTCTLVLVLLAYNPDATSFLLKIERSWFVSQEHCVHLTSFPTNFEHATLWWQKSRGEKTKLTSVCTTVQLRNFLNAYTADVTAVTIDGQKMYFLLG